MRKLIQERLLDLGLTMAEASVKIGRTHSYLQQFLKRGVPRELKERDRELLADVLKVHPDQLRGPSPSLPKRDYSKNNSAPRETVMSHSVQNALVSDTQQNPGVVSGAGLVGEAQDFPIFGTAEGGNGALVITDRAVDHMVRPEPLRRVREGYGIIVAGDSMAPGIKSGAIMLVNPHIPPRAEDVCIFRKSADDGTVHMVVKELINHNETVWRVRQYKPAKDFNLKKTEWQTCHVTVGQYYRR